MANNKPAIPGALQIARDLHRPEALLRSAQITLGQFNGAVEERLKDLGRELELADEELYSRFGPRVGESPAWFHGRPLESLQAMFPDHSSDALSDVTFTAEQWGVINEPLRISDEAKKLMTRLNKDRDPDLKEMNRLYDYRSAFARANGGREDLLPPAMANAITRLEEKWCVLNAHRANLQEDYGAAVQSALKVAGTVHGAKVRAHIASGTMTPQDAVTAHWRMANEFFRDVIGGPDMGMKHAPDGKMFLNFCKAAKLATAAVDQLLPSNYELPDNVVFQMDRNAGKAGFITNATESMR